MAKKEPGLNASVPTCTYEGPSIEQLRLRL